MERRVRGTGGTAESLSGRRSLPGFCARADRRLNRLPGHHSVAEDIAVTEHITAAEQVTRISVKIEVATQWLWHFIQQAVIVCHLPCVVFLAFRLAAVHIFNRVIVTLSDILSPAGKSGFPVLSFGAFQAASGVKRWFFFCSYGSKIILSVF